MSYKAKNTISYVTLVVVIIGSLIGVLVINASADQPNPSPTAAPTVAYPGCIEQGSGNIVNLPCVWDNSLPDGYTMFTLVKGTINGVGYGEDFPPCPTRIPTVGCVEPTNRTDAMQYIVRRP